MATFWASFRVCYGRLVSDKSHWDSNPTARFTFFGLVEMLTQNKTKRSAETALLASPKYTNYLVLRLCMDFNLKDVHPKVYSNITGTGVREETVRIYLSNGGILSI
jgi:isocitrate/isopropylmalate dehydrogenase